MASPGVSNGTGTTFIADLATGNLSMGFGGVITINNAATPPTTTITGPLTTTGLVTNTVTSIHVTKAASSNQSITTGASPSAGNAALVTWDALCATGGGNNGFATFAPGQSAFIIPATAPGTYAITAAVQWNSTAASIGAAQAWIDIGTGAVGTTNLWGGSIVSKVASAPLTNNVSILYQFVGGESVRVGVSQSTGAALTVTGDALNSMTLSIIRVGS
jgi:hypothetical protein